MFLHKAHVAIVALWQKEVTETGHCTIMDGNDQKRHRQKAKFIRQTGD